MSVWARFVQDCRDLWQLITKGQPIDDPLLPWRMMAELAKQPTIDLDAWEADMFARSGVWWFDPTRYDGTELAWPKQFTIAGVRIDENDTLFDLRQGSYVQNQQQFLMSQCTAQSQFHAYQAGLMQNANYANQTALINNQNAWHRGFDLLGMKH